MLTIQRPNARKTGAIATFGSLFPSDTVSLKVYPQKMSDNIEYGEPIEILLHYEDLSLILMVLLGYEESIFNGRGLYHQYKHHAVRILFRHLIEPIAGYELDITETENDGSKNRRARIILQTQDALALSYGIQGVLSKSLMG